MADFLQPSTVPMAPAVEGLEEWPYTTRRPTSAAQSRASKAEPADDSGSEDPDQDQEKHQLDLDA